MAYFPGVAEKIPAACLPPCPSAALIGFLLKVHIKGAAWVGRAEPQTCLPPADRLQLRKHEGSSGHREFTRRLFSFAINSPHMSNSFCRRRRGRIANAHSDISCIDVRSVEIMARVFAAAYYIYMKIISLSMWTAPRCPWRILFLL